VDGAPAARFLRELGDRLATPEPGAEPGPG